MTVTDHILVERQGAIQIVRMNRPDKKNALTRAMYATMSRALAEGDADPAVRVHVFLGMPGAFSAGNDLQDFMRAAQGGEGLGSPVLRFLHSLARCEKPLVAGVQGVAVGVGTTMLLHCDHVVAGDDARFTTPFVGLGLVPEAASSLLAPRLMGHRNAFSLLVMGRGLNAADAKACGLVNTIVPAAEVDAETQKAASHIASLPPGAVAASRRLIRGAPEEIIARIDEEARHFKERLKTPEARAAFEAFLSRKK